MDVSANECKCTYILGACFFASGHEAFGAAIDEVRFTWSLLGLYVVLQRAGKCRMRKGLTFWTVADMWP